MLMTPGRSLTFTPCLRDEATSALDAESEAIVQVGHLFFSCLLSHSMARVKLPVLLTSWPYAILPAQ